MNVSKFSQSNDGVKKKLNYIAILTICLIKSEPNSNALSGRPSPGRAQYCSLSHFQPLKVNWLRPLSTRFLCLTCKLLVPEWGSQAGSDCHEEEKSLTPMGVLAPESAYSRPFTWNPINMSGIFLANVSAELPSYISPNRLELISKVSEPWDNFWNIQK